MIGDTDVHIFSNKDGNDTSLASGIWWIEIEMLCNIWSDSTCVFFDFLFIINVWVVGLSNLEKFIVEMKLIMEIII